MRGKRLPTAEGRPGIFIRLEWQDRLRYPTDTITWPRHPSPTPLLCDGPLPLLRLRHAILVPLRQTLRVMARSCRFAALRFCMLCKLRTPASDGCVVKSLQQAGQAMGSQKAGIEEIFRLGAGLPCMLQRGWATCTRTTPSLWHMELCSPQTS